jgi:hypothetical protein
VSRFARNSYGTGNREAKKYPMRYEILLPLVPALVPIIPPTSVTFNGGGRKVSLPDLQKAHIPIKLFKKVYPR